MYFVDLDMFFSMKGTCFTMATLTAQMYHNVVHTLPVCLYLNVYYILIYYSNGAGIVAKH